MPCVGPSPGEIRQMEIAECKRLYGVAGTELDIATRVACHLAKGENNDLTKRWIAVHKQRDAERAQRERESKEEEAIQRELEAVERRLRMRRKDRMRSK